MVLASRSPRRREILGWLGIEFDAVKPDAEELTEGLPPEQLVVENARRKARAGLAQAGASAHAADLVILGVDTEVFLDGRALGQPDDRGGAEDRLRALAGREHEVLSGLCVLGAGGGERTAIARSLVTFADLSDELIAAYLDSGEWEGRAGGYAIQGLGSILIARVEGDFSNVVGLPIATLLKLAPELGVRPFPHSQR